MVQRVRNNPIRIGTRASKLAMWQAERVAEALEKTGFATTIIPVQSAGDSDLRTPLHQMGGQGVFTKALDEALLNNTIDVAVHSLKDLPTVSPDNLQIVGMLARDYVEDVLIYRTPKKDILTRGDRVATIATGSVRRKAQWLHRYPHHRIMPLRGNIQTRLAQLEKHDEWDAIILSLSGIMRMGLDKNLPMRALDFMLPAPGQGVIAIVARRDDYTHHACVLPLHDVPTERAVHAERDFLHALGAGCSTPVSAHAQCTPEGIIFHGNVTSTDGMFSYTIRLYDALSDIGKRAAEMLLRENPAVRTLLAS